MDCFTPRQLVPSALLAVILLGTNSASAPAADPQKDIVDGLRAKGHFSEAIDYLRRARANPNAPKAFVETIDFELAVTQIDLAASLVETEQDKPLQLAQEALTKFLSEHARHFLVVKAKSQLGNVLLDRARLQRILAGQYEGPARQKLLEAARGFLQEADEQWAGIDKANDEELKQMGLVRSDDAKRIEARDEIHRRQLQARLARAWVQYETGQTWPVGGSERTSALQEAGNRFDALYDQQRERLAGFYARLGRGLCLKELGENQKAFAVFEELLGLPDDPADFHTLRGKAAVEALQIAIRPDVKKYKQGLDIARKWLSGDHPSASSGEERAISAGIDRTIRFLGGEAAFAYGMALSAPSLDQSALRAQQLDWAKQQFQVVAAAAGSYQAQAKVRLLDPALGPAETCEPGTFADARNHAKAALDRFLAAQSEQQEAARTGTDNDRDSQRQRQRQIAAAQSEALKYCRLALDLSKAGSRVPGSSRPSPEDCDTVRYYLTYLRYASGELDEAAVLGEALAEASSDSSAARQAARIGLAAREALFRRAGDDTRPTALQRLQTLAEKIIQRWGNRAEADDARGILLDLALDESRPEKAEPYLQQISEASPRRGEAELSLGTALWQKAQQLLQTSTLEHDHTAEAEKIIAHAATMLSDGITRCRDAGAGAKESLPAAMLALAQIHMTTGQPAEALPLLEDPNLAGGDSCCLALLAYLATGQSDKAAVCLQTLQTSPPPANNADNVRQVFRTCVRFRHLLKQYLTGYRDRRQDDLVKKIRQQFDDFLASLSQGPASGTSIASIWRAEIHLGLAEGLDVGGPAVLPEAKQHYLRAIATLQQILQREATRSELSPVTEVAVALRIELARCLRRLSDNPQALNQLVTVLKNHPLMVDAQVEAAYTYQSWGDEKPEYLEMAIQGDKRHQEVWGWGELARRVQSEARFRDIFHEARYNLALCRLHQAQIAADRPQRVRLAEAAENDILVTGRLFPDMGGAVWYDRYNELFKRLQRLADRPAVGLPTR